ncbi:MAG: NAD-dependent epimerase/dehydratase family protein [Gammaproteobacteria bacterium]|nr:NAD-dependent epimerase/dehydratase family protein [Gammaproteobacteria bacterium]
MKNILVTGGAGFIGSHTTDLLLQSGYRVVVFDNLSTGKSTNLDLFHPALSFVPGDILDYPALLTQIKRCDAVLHLAALASVPKSIEDPVNSLKVNTQGFLHVLQGIREAGKPIRLVYASSAAVYGADSELPCNDEIPGLPFTPLSPYALEKISNERYADLYARLFGIKSIALRYFNVYGPRQDPGSPYSGVISRFVQHYQNQDTITIRGDGMQSRDFIYVADIARANLLALSSDYAGALNVATGTPETLQNLVHCIELVGGRSAHLEYVQAAAGDIRESYARTAKAEKALSFSYSTQLVDGIRLLMR